MTPLDEELYPYVKKLDEDGDEPRLVVVEYSAAGVVGERSDEVDVQLVWPQDVAVRFWATLDKNPRRARRLPIEMIKGEMQKVADRLEALSERDDDAATALRVKLEKSGALLSTRRERLEELFTFLDGPRGAGSIARLSSVPGVELSKYTGKDGYNRAYTALPPLEQE